MNTLTKINRCIGILFLSTLCLASCTKDDGRPEQVSGQTTGRTVRREVTVQAAPMLSAQGEGATRATVEVPLNEDEAKIHTLWVLQFGGTADGSMLIKKTEVGGSEINATTGVFDFDFEELADGGQIKVYLLANFRASVLSGFVEGSTTLAAFEASNLSVPSLTAEAMKTDGLPMVGAQSFDYTKSNPAAFAMKSLLAKVVFQYSAIGFSFSNVNLSAHNLANVVPVTEPTAGADVQHPAGTDYTGSLTLVDDLTYKGDRIVCYLPENLAGQVAAITQDKERGGNNVPQGAAFIFINAGGLLSASSYHFYIGDGTPPDFNMQRHYEYTFDMKLRGMNLADKRVVAGGPANCYIVTSPGMYAFDATVRGNGDESVPDINYSTLPDLTTATEARVIWEQGSGKGEVISAVSLDKSSGKVSFNIGSATEGNAVIGLFASSAAGAPCLWSWHIWRLSSAPTDVACTKTPSPVTASATFEMMDRNLGAFNNTQGNVGSIGLLYQWGRKDPFPGPAGFNTTEPNNIYGSVSVDGTVTTLNGIYTLPTVKGNASNGTINYAIQYPGVFIYANTNNDWLSAKNDNLWGTPWIAAGSVGSYNGNQGTKSICDPCPIGYRVPPQDTWSKQTAAGAWSNNGMVLSSVAANFWFPAAGYRWGDSDAGKLAYGGSDGRYWSSSPYSATSNYGGRLNFVNGNVNPQYDYSRANAFSVRCVSE